MNSLKTHFFQVSYKQDQTTNITVFPGSQKNLRGHHRPNIQGIFTPHMFFNSCPQIVLPPSIQKHLWLHSSPLSVSRPSLRCHWWTLHPVSEGHGHTQVCVFDLITWKSSSTCAESYILGHGFNSVGWETTYFATGSRFKSISVTRDKNYQR